MSFGTRRLRAAHLLLTFHVFVTCVLCKSKSSFPVKLDQDVKVSTSTISDIDDILAVIDETSRLQRCATTSKFFVIAIPLPTHEFDQVRQKVDLIAKIMGDYFPHSDERILKTFLQKTTKMEPLILSGRLIWVGNGSLLKPQFYVAANYNGKNVALEERRNFALKDQPWMSEKTSVDKRHPQEDYFYGSWSNPYFLCEKRRWLISYTAFAYSDRLEHKHKKRQTLEKMVGLVSVDVDVTEMDVNQCDVPWAGETNTSATLLQMTEFLSTHKCHNSTSQCIFIPGEGWARGSYTCRCRDGYFSPAGKPIFNGNLVESAWKEKQSVQSPTYDVLYVCRPCQKGCHVCVDDSPCLSHYNWAFRISLLTISVICILLTILLALNIYRYRKLKVIKVASPIFLCITLLGCATMYAEMAAIFPVLDVYSCVATKWTRNMGFCITYSALLLKTWRVSLTYRVKSAHKLKLTDKQLLQWLFPILLVMAIYLGTWTISSPPEAVYIVDWFNLKFKICDYNWWDHSLAIGELVFLLWGIRVCYNVRNAESFFNEAKHITWAVYNITIVNLIMLMIHLVILPKAGPDVKYLFGFIRTQLSTTVTIILIFGPKFYRVIKGQGDTWDNRARARGVTASFSLNGVGLVHEETPDLFQENEELKEEIQKLAAQIEFMKIVHMEMNNRHLKPKHGSFFSQSNSNQSPVTKSIYMKFESTDSPGSRISPAAELISEHV